MNDLRYALRMLLKQPGFTAVAVLTLALGIGANTAMYSVIYAVVLDPFPYNEVDNLMSVKVWDPGQPGYRTYYSTDEFIEIAERNSIFEGVIASTISDIVWTGDGDPQRLRGNHGTPNTFQVMGVPPLLGRTIIPSDGEPGAEPVAVLGYRFWQRQFGGDPRVVGRQLRLNDKVRTVVGVMPKRFMWRGADVYLPIVFERGRMIEGVRWVHLLGRLKPGVTAAQAEADLRPIIEDLKKMEPGQIPDKWRVGLLSFKETFPSSIRENLWILFGAVGLLLLIACANASTLLLSKAGARLKEMAVRSALGASRARLLRQLLTESLILAVASGVLGVALASGGLQAILSLVPPDTVPDESEIAVNTPVLLFTLGVSALTSILFGLAPALHICTRDVANSLRETGRAVAVSIHQAYLRKSLLIAEVALSLMLLVGASLMIRTFLAMRDVHLGFRADRLLAMRVPLSEQRYPDPQRRVAFFQELLNRVSAIPGVKAVGLNTSVHPLGNWGLPVDVPGSAQPDTRRVVVHQVNPDYTRALGISLVEGRLFAPSEVDNQQHLAIVNQTFVRTRLGDQDPLGRTIRIPSLNQAPFAIEDNSFQIVGVVKDTLNRGLTDQVMPEIYLPFTLLGLANRVVTLTQADPASLAHAVLGQVYAIDRNQPVTDVRTMETVLNEGIYAGPRFNLALFTVFAGLGLTLAIIGVYGVMSNTVAQQTHDIGVRMALGAQRRDVLGLVVGQGMRLALIGVGAGAVGALALTRIMRNLLYGVEPTDPLTFVSVSLLLAGVAVFACWLPARRASKVAPMEALRYE